MPTLEQQLARLSPERYLDRLDRWREQRRQSVKAPVPAIQKLASLREQLSSRFGPLAEGLMPRLAQVEHLVALLFPVDPAQEISAKDKAVVGGALEDHFELLEDTIYALCLGAGPGPGLSREGSASPGPTEEQPG